MKFRILLTLAALVFIVTVYIVLQGNGVLTMPQFGDSGTTTQQ